MNNYVPIATLAIPNNPELALALTKNFQQLQLNGLNIMDGTIGTSKLATTITDTDTSITYTGSWSIETATQSSPTGLVAGYNKSYHSSKTVGDTFTYSGRFSSVILLAIQGSNCGQISISIDGANTTSIDLYSGTTQVANVYEQDVVYGQHTVVVTILSTKNSLSSDHYCNFVGLSSKYQLTDENIAAGGLSDISINSVNASKIIAGSIMFNVVLNNGNNTFSVDQNGVVKASSGTIGGFTLGATTFTSTNGNFILDSANNRLEMLSSGIPQIVMQA